LSLALYSGVQLWGVASGLAGLSRSIKLLGTASVVAEGEVAVVGGEVGIASTGLLGLATSIGSIAAVAGGAALAVELLVNKLNPKFHFDNSHAGMLNSELTVGARSVDAVLAAVQRAFPAAFPMTPLGQGGQDRTIHIHGNVVVHANDAGSFAKSLVSKSAAATRHPVGSVNTIYSSGF
jgi:hypothetical protein